VRARAAKRPRKGRLILWVTLLLSGTVFSSSHSSAASLIRDNFGSVGMIEMPSARMAPDGEISAGASFFQNTQHYNFGFQMLPWLEASFRYSGLQHFDPNFPVYYDRSFALKARLWDETGTFPAVAIGINDVVGTGIYGSEYLVASKQFGPIDASLGIGWARLGNTNLIENPLGAAFPSFKHRVQYPDISPGATSFNSLFHGPSVGLFGGVTWHTPIDQLSLIAEYSSDTYKVEAARGNFRPRSQMNYGASYQLGDNVTIGLAWLYGRSISGNVLFELNPTKAQYPTKLGTPPPDVTIRTAAQQTAALQTLKYKTSYAKADFKKTTASRSDFVDALWKQNDLSNVEVKGQTLVLTAAENTGQHCIAVAQLAETYGSRIKTVVIGDGDGHRPVQCTTTSANEGAYRSVPADLQMPAPLNAPSSKASVQIIDATLPNVAAVKHAIRSDARTQQIKIEAVDLTDSTASVYYTNSHYFSEVEAIDRLTRILMKNAPPNVEKFRLIPVANGVPQQEFDILRGPEERKFAQAGRLDQPGEVQAATIGPAPMQNPALESETAHSYPRLSWSVFPQLRQELFDPNNPFAIQLTTAAAASVELVRGFSVNGEAETSIFDNFNTGRKSDSTLPHVRSDFLEYFARGKTGIGQLDAQYRFRLAPTVFALAKAGYLESMFAGAGGEILWRPEGQRWTLGADVYEVWQRGFDRLFDLQDYSTFTGHISLYYASPWHELNFMVSAGQYLAGDRGLTFQVTRRFSTGVEVGAFFTKTNVSSERFGEGSFDKGILIRIPLGWSLPINTQGQFNMDLRPVQRDGGQRLSGDTVLYGETQRVSEAEMGNITTGGSPF
jgi:hypothetical protein